MSEREALLRRLSSARFAAWEMHLFLDTHPNDRAAMESQRKYEERAQALMEEYQSKFGPLNSDDIYGDVRWDWINSPWPWENVMEGK